MNPTHFALVGGGWRAEFYLRVARALSRDLAVDGVVVRNREKGVDFERRWAVKTYRTTDELLRATDPDFVVTCVSWESNPLIVEQITSHDLPVLSETPPAPDLAGLSKLWSLVAKGARIQVAEQYIYQPHHAARLALIESGDLGTISQVQVSVAHGYHGVSLLRHFLGIGFEDVQILARGFDSSVVAGPTRSGPPDKEQFTTSSQTLAWLDYGDRLGIYDFCGEQYLSWIRGQRLLVRGERGEIIDHHIRYLLDYAHPADLILRRITAGANGNLEGFYLKGIVAGDRWLYRNPFAPARLSDEEIAVATVLTKMSDYVESGAQVYSLGEACQDRYFDILISQAKESGETITSEAQPWASRV